MIIADDEPITRMGLRSLDWEEEGFELVGLGANGLEALELIRAVNPDLVLTDIKMPRFRRTSLNGAGTSRESIYQMGVYYSLPPVGLRNDSNKIGGSRFCIKTYRSR
ncbi:response regulator [Paenibacillus sp. V4I3]|uniref:response regulator n=1 Tax=Paenibacillus sp. V4I3 TaxID=3042305 RepID=UPI0027D76E52|nr:response regulator [Paenibacillus sp. V4I3]